MLVGTLKVQISRERHAFVLAEYTGVGHAGIEPDIEGVAGFFIVSGVITEQLRCIEFEPGVDVLPLDALRDLFDTAFCMSWTAFFTSPLPTCPLR